MIYDSGDNPELIETLPVFTTANYRRLVMMMTDIPIQAGQDVEVHAECQVDNNLGYNVGVTGELMIRWLGNVPPVNGENVTPDTHHLKVQKYYAFTATVTADYFFRMYLYAYSTKANNNNPPSPFLKVRQNYGRMFIVVK